MRAESKHKWTKSLIFTESLYRCIVMKVAVIYSSADCTLLEDWGYTSSGENQDWLVKW